MPLPKQPRAVITGAASGLGRALALELAKRRARVLVADIDLDGARETVRLVNAAGGEAFATQCDVTQAAAVAALPDEAEDRLGGADLIINNAGVAVGGPMDTIPLADWEWVMGINLWGVIHGCHAFVPFFKKQGGGRILNVASAAGLLCSPAMAPYNVTKAGVIALSETLAAELHADKIGVTVLCPTFFKTQIADRARSHGDVTPALIHRLMDRASVQADGVAKHAIDAVDAGRLYALPHRDGRLLWRLKRAAPETFYRRILAQMQRFVR